MIRRPSWLRRSHDQESTSSSDEALAALERVRSLTGTVDAVGGLALELRNSNHFSAMVRIAISQAKDG